MPDAIVLVGLSGSGKSSVGRLLSERLGRPFVDLDAEIERREGASPARLITEHGEPAFRALEAAAVERAVAVDGAVIATGGGAVIDPLVRWSLWHAGTVVWLDADDEILLARLSADAVERPILAGDAAERMRSLRAERSGFYRAADLRIEASATIGGATDAVAEAVTTAARRPADGVRARRLLDVEVRRDHPMGPPRARIVLGRDLDEPTLHAILEPIGSGTPVVVADRRAAAALPALLDSLSGDRRLLIPAGERQKRLRSIERLLEAASGMGAERGDAWIAIGGGTATDLIGAAAALYLRGAPFVAVPTTWLGMADAAIGGKVAVDLLTAKNAAGAFWPPAAVIADIATLRTLPRARRLDGMAESLKSGLIGDPGLWALIEARGRAALRDDEAARYAIVERSARLKLGVVDRDPFERGERRTLNLGHTLGHALEVESRYRLPHGQAVVLGLRAVAAIARGRGAEPGLPERIDELVSSLGYSLRRAFDANVVKAAMSGDKKRHQGRQRWILPMAVGHVIEIDDVSEAELDAAIGVISAGAREAVAA